MKQQTSGIVYVLAVLAGVLLLALEFYTFDAERRSKDPDSLLIGDEFNYECIAEYELEGDPVTVDLDESMGDRAKAAARGLRDLEKQVFDLKADCVNVHGAQERARASMVFQVLESSGWTRTKLVHSTRQASRILSQCGIYFDDISVTMIDGDPQYLEVDSVEYFQLVSATRKRALPYLYFMNQQALSKNRVFGKAYTDSWRDWPNRSPEKFRQYADVSADSADQVLGNIALIVHHHHQQEDPGYYYRTSRLGITIAHELYHIYGNCTCHEKDTRNFMYPGGRKEKLNITAEQCDIAVAGIRRLKGRENRRIMTLDLDEDL